MAAKGAIAKEKVIKKIEQTFGSDYIGIYDKKIYLWSEENGEKIQIALTLTCPKNLIEANSFNEKESASELNFEDTTSQKLPIINEEERENINKLMQKLGL